MSETKRKMGIRAISGLFGAVAIFGLSFFVFSESVSGSECSLLSGDEKDKCESLEKKAKTYQNIIDIKNKQQDTLQSQVQLINKEQTNNQQVIQDAHVEAQTLAEKIVELERQIAQKEELARYQKTVLANLVRSYYENSQPEIVKVVLIDKDFSEILNTADYSEQSSAKVKEILVDVQNTKNELQKQSDELAQKREEKEKVKSELENRNAELEASERQKQNLLAQTQGEEDKYRKLLERVEQQKMELFNFGEASNSEDVIASVGDYAKPDSKYWASTGWYFSQRDSRWGGKTIGNSKTLMRDYGCAVTAVSMVFRSYGAKIDPGVMAKQKIFSYDLIQWPGSWSPGIRLISSVGHNGVNWKTVDAEIKKGHLVIVFIKKSNGGGGHYVVVHNKDSKDYVVHDPYFGSNLYLGTSRSLVGKIGKDSGTVVDQMIIYE